MGQKPRTGIQTDRQTNRQTGIHSKCTLKRSKGPVDMKSMIFRCWTDRHTKNNTASASAGCNQLATFMRIFTYKLATYLLTHNVAGLQNALFCGSCRVSRECSVNPWSYRLLRCSWVVYRERLRVRLVLVFGCMLPVDMNC